MPSRRQIPPDSVTGAPVYPYSTVISGQPLHGDFPQAFLMSFTNRHLSGQKETNVLFHIIVFGILYREQGNLSTENMRFYGNGIWGRGE